MLRLNRGTKEASKALSTCSAAKCLDALLTMAPEQSDCRSILTHWHAHALQYPSMEAICYSQWRYLEELMSVFCKDCCRKKMLCCGLQACRSPNNLRSVVL